MNASVFATLGTALGLLGLALCTAAGIARVLGMFIIFGYESMTIFSAGAVFMIAACLLKLHAVQLRVSGES